MPFQVTYTQRAIPSGIIQSISAGEDGIAVCDVNFALTATVIGELDGHTILWEQVSGTPVTFDTQLDQLSISYSQTTFDDKVFRFYIDKGGAGEAFDDVTVYGSPVSVNKIAIRNSIPLFNTSTSTHGDAVSLRILSPYPEIQQDSYAEFNMHDMPVLSWDATPSSNKLLSYTIQERDNSTGNITDLATVSPDTLMYYGPLTLGSSYIVTANLLHNNSSPYSVSSNIVWNMSRDDGIYAVSSATKNVMLASPAIFNYDVETLVVISKDDVIDNRNIYMKSSISNFEYATEQLRISTKPYSDDMAGKRIIPSDRSVIITDFDVADTTGGQVGG